MAAAAARLLGLKTTETACKRSQDELRALLVC